MSTTQPSAGPEFQVLGSLRVLCDGREVTPAGSRARTILAALLLRSGHTVRVDQLVLDVWGDTPPENPKQAVQTVMSRVRTALAVCGPDLIERVHDGYRLNVPEAQLDLSVFRALTAEAAQTEDPVARAELLDQALGRWRGEPLTGAGAGSLADRFVAGLELERVAARENRAKAWVESGRCEDAISELSELTREHPLREDNWYHLVLARQLIGRPAEALASYDKLRRLLADELGTDPAEPLRELHRSLLSGTFLRVRRYAAAATATVRESAHRSPGPEGSLRQLPADVARFVGREAELAALTPVPPEPGVVCAVDGMAGVGKTAFAVHAAHRLAELCPDGQLFVNLHGYTRGVEPADPGEVLGRVLPVLGVPPDQLPSHLDDRAALFRGKLAGRRMLILLDNAVSEEQVRPLLPGLPGCVVLVTSRHRLVGLDRTHTVSLDPLSLAAAVELFRTTAGPAQTSGSQQAVLAAIVEQCGRLPLAVQIAAARLRMHPAWDASHLLGRLTQGPALAELELGDRSFRVAVDLSYLELSPQARQAYRALSLHPGEDFTPEATAALLDCTAGRSRMLLEQLLEAHLIQEPTPERYQFHDLIREHAAHAAETEEPPESLHSAAGRLVSYYCTTAATSVGLLYPDQRPTTDDATFPRTPDQATAWLESELTNLFAVTQVDLGFDPPLHPLRLVRTLIPFLLPKGVIAGMESFYRRGLASARAVGDLDGELEIMLSLSDAHRLTGDYDTAADYARRALTSARANHRDAAEAQALWARGLVAVYRDRAGEGLDDLRRAHRIIREVGDQLTELKILSGLAFAYYKSGDYPQRHATNVQALELARVVNPRVIGKLLSGLGQDSLRQGRLDEAARYFQQSLDHALKNRNRFNELRSLDGLAETYRQLGRSAEAETGYRRSFQLAREIGSRNYELEALQGQGRLFLATARPALARASHQQALDLAVELGQIGDQARAHDGLAQVHQSLGDTATAQQHWQKAVALMTAAGLAHTDEPEVNLRTLTKRLTPVTRPAES